ncbi:hypothetical protein C3943_19435 [Lysinibacillus sp. B2A1]|nr:hypothetical protein C3943_19435 [Lysinibacillus sp. B2A1]
MFFTAIAKPRFQKKSKIHQATKEKIAFLGIAMEDLHVSIYNPVNFLSILMQVQHMVIHTIVSLKEFYHANLKKVYMYYQKD